MKFYKFMLRFIQIFVILVVLPRVANFVGLLGAPSTSFTIHDLIRFAFAASLGLGTIATAYFSDDAEAPTYEDEPNNPKERRRREREAIYIAAMQNAAPYARRAMFLFAFLDGTFNLADALYGASASGLLDPAVQGYFAVIVYGTATLLFGIAPTILAIVLSKVISMVDRIPVDYEKPVGKRQIDLVRTLLGNMGLHEYTSGDAARLMNVQNEQPLIEHSTERSNEKRAGGQTERVLVYLNEFFATNGTIPGPRTIERELGVSVGTASAARRTWIEQNR